MTHTVHPNLIPGDIVRVLAEVKAVRDTPAEPGVVSCTLFLGQAPSLTAIDVVLPRGDVEIARPLLRAGMRVSWDVPYVTDSPAFGTIRGILPGEDGGETIVVIKPDTASPIPNYVALPASLVTRAEGGTVVVDEVTRLDAFRNMRSLREGPSTPSTAKPGHPPSDYLDPHADALTEQAAGAIQGGITGCLASSKAQRDSRGELLVPLAPRLGEGAFADALDTLAARR